LICKHKQIKNIHNENTLVKLLKVYLGRRNWESTKNAYFFLSFSAFRAFVMDKR